MNQNMPNPEPHEQAISFDDLEIEQQPTEIAPDAPEPLVPSSGSLKDKVIAQIKQEKAETISKPAVPPPAPDMQSTGPASFSEPAITYPETKPVAVTPDVQPKLPPVPVVQPEVKPVVEVKDVTVESRPEVQIEQPTTEKVETPTPKKGTAVTPATAPTTPPPPPTLAAEKTEVRRQIESILQNELTGMFAQMQPQERIAFSKAANETAGKLEVLVSQFKATAKEVLNIIRAWLKKIPRVNKYFLEQASKIKTDEIMEVQRQAKKRSRLIH